MMSSVIPARLVFLCGHAALVSLPRIKGETSSQRADRVAREKSAAHTRACDFCAQRLEVVVQHTAPAPPPKPVSPLLAAPVVGVPPAGATPPAAATPAPSALPPTAATPAPSLLPPPVAATPPAAAKPPVPALPLADWHADRIAKAKVPKKSRVARAVSAANPPAANPPAAKRPVGRPQRTAISSPAANGQVAAKAATTAARNGKPATAATSPARNGKTATAATTPARNGKTATPAKTPARNGKIATTATTPALNWRIVAARRRNVARGTGRFSVQFQVQTLVHAADMRDALRQAQSLGAIEVLAISCES